MGAILEIFKKILIGLLLVVLVFAVIILRTKFHNMETKSDNENAKMIQESFNNIKMITDSLQESQKNIDARLSKLDEAVKSVAANYGKDSDKYNKITNEISSKAKEIEALKIELGTSQKVGRDNQKKIEQLNKEYADIKNQIEDLKDYSRDLLFGREKYQYEDDSLKTKAKPKTPQTTSLGTISFKK